MKMTKVTRKGQITIPKEVRDTLGITDSDYVVVVVDGDAATLYPVRSGRTSALKGQLPATKRYPGSDQIRREVAERLGEQMEKRDR